MITTETAFCPPPAPQSLEDSGLSADLVLQIVTKTLHLAGELSGTELSERLGVTFQIVEPALALLKREHHCEISGGSVLGGPSFRYRLTDAGRVRAALFLEHDHYIGALPVPLEQYSAYMEQFAGEDLHLNRELIRHAFAHLVLSPRVLDQLGPAIAARHSLFVYGPPGNGKTVISQAIREVLSGDMAVPHALSIEGHIIRVFDPVNHERIDGTEDSSGLARSDSYDGRWVRCRRPLITAGGELTLDGLELGPPVGVEAGDQPASAAVVDDAGDRVDEPAHGVHRRAVGRRHRVRQRVVRPEVEARGVEQHQGRAHEWTSY